MGRRDHEDRSVLRDLRVKAQARAEELEGRAGEVLDLTGRIEELAAGTPARYSGMRTRVEAEATLRQVRDLIRTLEELGERAERPG